MEKIYHDVIPILPSNCQSIVGELDQEINKIFRALSRKHYNHFDLYMHLLPYVYEKCDYHVLHFIDVLMNAIKDHTKRRKLWELKTGKVNTHINILYIRRTAMVHCKKGNVA